MVRDNIVGSTSQNPLVRIKNERQQYQTEQGMSQHLVVVQQQYNLFVGQTEGECLFQRIGLKKNVSSCKAQRPTKRTRRLIGPSARARKEGRRGDAAVTSGSNEIR